MLFLQRYVHIVLDAVLGSYVKDIDPEALKISVWNGKIEVDVVELQSDAFPLPPEFRIVKGTLHQVRIDLPWANLASQPIRVDVQDVNLLLEVCDRRPEATAGANADADAKNNDPKRRNETLKRKRATLDAIEKATQFNKPVASEKPKRWTQTLLFKLLVKVLDNVQLNVQQIHLRMEDRVSSPEKPFAVGVTLASMVIKSADAGWNYTTIVRGSATPRSGGADDSAVASFLRKKVDINKFGLYWSLPLSPLPPSALEDSFEFMKLMQMNFWSGDLAARTENTRLFQPKDYIIEPLTLSLKLTINDGRAKLPITHEELCTRVMTRLGTPWMVQTIAAIGDDAWQDFVDGMPKLTGDRIYTLSFVFSQAWAVAREHNDEEDVVPTVKQFKDALSSCLQWSLAEVDRLEGSISKYRDAVIHVLEEKSTYIDASASVDHINVVIQRPQYLSALNLVSFLAVKRRQARYAHLRPQGVRVKDDPRQWWGYAISSVLIDVRERLARVDMEEIRRAKEKRARYKALYLLLSQPAKKATPAMALVGLVPDDVLQLQKDAAKKELDDLEVELDIKELFHLRNTARHSVVEHASKPPPAVKPSEKPPSTGQSGMPVGEAAAPVSSKLWAYTSWLYSGTTASGGGDAKALAPAEEEMQWSDQDTKTLYEAIDFDPDEDPEDDGDGLAIAKRSDRLGQHIWYRCQFLLARTSLRLVGDDPGSEGVSPLLAAVALSNVDFKVLVRPKSVEVGIQLGDASVVGLASSVPSGTVSSGSVLSGSPRLIVQRMSVDEIISHHPKFVSDNMSSVRLRHCERVLPLIDVSIELKGSKRKTSLGTEDATGDGTTSVQGIAVSVVAQAIKCNFDVGALLRVTSFFARPSHVDLTGLRERAWRQAQSLQRYSAAQVHAALARRSNVELLVDIISPLITVRESPASIDDEPRSSARLLVFLGHLRASSRRGSDSKQEGMAEVSLLTGAKPKDHLYDEIDVGVSAIEVLLSDDGPVPTISTQLLEKTSVHIGVYVSIAPNDPTIPLVKVVGGVESVRVNLDADTFGLLVRLLRSIGEDFSRVRGIQGDSADDDVEDEVPSKSVVENYAHKPSVDASASHDDDAFFSGFESETRFYSQQSQRSLGRASSILASSPAGSALYNAFTRMRDSDRESRSQKEIDDKDLLKLWQRVLFMVRFQVREVAVALKLAPNSAQDSKVVRVGMANIETEFDMRTYDKQLRFVLGSFAVEERRKGLEGRFLIASGDLINCPKDDGKQSVPERLIRLAISSVDLEAPKPKDSWLWAQLCDSSDKEGRATAQGATVWQDQLLTGLSVDARLQTLVLNLHQDAFADLFVFFYRTSPEPKDSNPVASQPTKAARSNGASASGGIGKPPIVRKVAKSPSLTERSTRSTSRKSSPQPGLTSKIGTWVASSLAERMSTRRLRREPSVVSPVASNGESESLSSPASIQLRLQVAGLSVVLHNPQQESANGRADAVFIRLVANDFGVCVHRFPEYLGVYAHLMSMRVTDETVPDPSLQEILGSEKRESDSEFTAAATSLEPGHIPTVDDALQVVDKVPAIFSCAAQLYGADNIQEKWHPGYASRFTVRLNSPRIRVLYRFLDDLRSYFVDGVLLQTVMRTLFPHQVQVAWDEDFLVSSFSTSQHPANSTGYGSSPRPPPVKTSASEVVSTFPLLDIRLVDAKLRIPVHRTSSEALVVRFDTFRMSNEYLQDMFRGMNNRVMAKVLLNSSLSQLKIDLDSLRVVSVILVDPSYDGQQPSFHNPSGEPAYLRPELLTQSLLGSTSMTVSTDFSSGNATTVGIEFSPLRVVCNREQYAFLFRLPIQNFGEARLRASGKKAPEAEVVSPSTPAPLSADVSEELDDLLEEDEEEEEEEERELIVTVKVPQFTLEILHGQDGYQPSTSGDMSMAEEEKRAPGSICSVDVSEFNASVHYGMKTRSVRVSSELLSMRIRDTRHDSPISASYRDVVVFEPPNIAGVPTSSISIRVLHGRLDASLQQERALECSFASPHQRKPRPAPGSEDSGQSSRRLRKLSSSFFGSDTLIGMHPVPRRASSVSSGQSYPFSKSGDSEAGSDGSLGSLGSQGTRRRRRSSADARSPSIRTDVIIDVEGFRVIPSNIHYDVLRFLESPGRAAWSSTESSRESEEDVEEYDGDEEDGDLPTAEPPSTRLLHSPQHYVVLALTLGKSAVLLVEDPSKALSRAVMFSWEASVTVEFLRRPTPTLPTTADAPPNHRLQVRVELSNIQATSRLSQNSLWTRGNEATKPTADQSSDISGDFLKPCGLECRLDVDFATGFVRLKASFDRVLDLRFGYLDVCSLRGALEEIVSFPVVPSEEPPTSSSTHGTLGGRRFSTTSSVTSTSSAINPELDAYTLASTRGPLSEDGDVRQSSHRRKLRDRSSEPSLCYGTTMVYLVSATFRGPLNVRPALGLYSSPWRKRYLVLPYTAQDRQSVQPTMFRIIPAAGSRRNIGDPVRFGDHIALQAVQPKEKPVEEDDDEESEENESDTQDAATGTTICKYEQLGATGYLGPDGSAGVFETRIWKYGTSAFNSDRSIIRHKDAIVMEELTIYRAFSKQGKTFYGGSRLVSAQFDMMENGDNARASNEGGGYLMFNGVGDAPIPFVVSVNTDKKEKTSTPRSTTKKTSTPKSPIRPQSATTSAGVAMWNKLKVFQFHLPGVNATVVNDFHNMLLPLLHLRVVQLTLDLRGSFDSRLTAMAGLQVGIQSYNSQLAVWEPLVEDFDVHVAVHLKGGAICDFCMSDRQQISLAGTKLRCEGIPTCLFGATKTVVFAPAAARASETKHFIYQELLHHQVAQASAAAHSGTHEDDAKLVTTCLLVIKKAITVNVSRNGVNVLLQFLDLISRAGTNAEQDAAWRSRLGAFVYVDNQSGIPFLVAGHSGAAPPPTSHDSFAKTSQLLPQSSSFFDDSGDETVKLPTLSVGSEEGLMNYAAASASGGGSRPSLTDASWINNEQLTAVMKDMMSKSTHWLSVADGERVATDIVAHEAPAGSVTSPLRRLMWMRPKSSSSSSKPIPVPIGYSNRSYLHLESRSGFKDSWHGESIICETVAEQGTLVMRLRGKVQLLNHLAFPVEVSYNDQRQEVLAANGRTPHFVPIQYLDGGDMTLCPLLEDGRLQRSTHISIASLLRAPVLTSKSSGTGAQTGALEVRKVLTFYWDVHPDEGGEGDDGAFGVSRPPFQVILTASRKSEKSEALITISPPIRLENLVPFALSFRTVCTKSERDLAWVHDNAASFSGTHGTVASGHSAQVCELEIFHNRATAAQIDTGLVPSAVALSIAIPGIGYRTYSAWNESSFIYGSNKLCSRIELIKSAEEADGDEAVGNLCPLHLRVEIVSTERLGTTALNQLAPAICRIYAEYWLIDRTCMSIVMRTPDGRRVLPWSEASDRHAPVALFSGLKNKAQVTPKIKIGVRTAGKDVSGAEVESKAFDIGTVGLRGQITLRAGDRNVRQGAMSMLPSLRMSELSSVPISHKQYDIGVMIEQGPSIFSRTTVVTFVPRYYFINTSDRFQLLIKQERDDDANAITLRPRQGCFFHWNDARLRTRVQLRFVCLKRQCTDGDFGEFYDGEEEKEDECSSPHGISEWSLPFEVTSVGNFVIRLHRALAKASSFFSDSCFLSEDAHAAALADTESLTEDAPCEALSGMSLHVGVELHDPAFVVRFQEGRTFEASTEEELRAVEDGGAEAAQVKDFVSFKLKNECTAFELFVWQKIPANDTSGAESGDGNATAFTYEGFDRVFPFQTIDFVPFAASVAPVLHVQIQSVFQSSSTASVSNGNDDESDEHSGANASSSSGVAPPRVVGSFEVALDKLHRLPVIEIHSEGKSPKRLWVEVALEDATKTLRVTDVLPGASSEHKRRRRTALLRSWKRYNASVLWYSRVLFESHRHRAITMAAVGQKEGDAQAESADQAKQRKQVRFANDVKESSDAMDMDEEIQEDSALADSSSSMTQAGPALVVAMRIVDAVHLEDLYPPETNASGVAPFVRVRMKGKQDQEVAARTLRTQSTRAIFPRWVPAKIKKSKGSEILFQRFSLEEEAKDEDEDEETKATTKTKSDPLCVELEVREGNKLLIFGSSLLGSATISLRELIEAARSGESAPQHQPLRVQEMLVPLLSSSSASVGIRSMVRVQLVVGNTLEDPTLSTTTLEDAIRNFSVEAQLDRLVRCKSQLKVLLERESVDLALGDGTSAPANGSPPSALAQPVVGTRAPATPSLTAERLEARLESRQESYRTASTAPSVTTDDSASDFTNDSSYDERVLSVVVMGVTNLQMAPAEEPSDAAAGAAAPTLEREAERKVYCTVSYKESTRAATSSVAKKAVGSDEPATPPQPSQGRGQRPSQTRFVHTHKFKRGEKLGLDLIYHSGRVVVQGVTYNGPCGKLVQDGDVCIGDTIVAVNDKSIVNLHRDACFRAIANGCGPAVTSPNASDPGTFSLSFLRQPPVSFGHVAHAQDQHSKDADRYEAEWNRRVEFVETPQSAAESPDNPKNKVLVRVYKRNEMSDHGLTAAQESSVVPFLYFFGDEDTMDHLDHSKEDTRFDTLLGEAWVSVPTPPSSSKVDTMSDLDEQELSVVSECLCALYAPTSNTRSSFSSTARAMVGQVRLALKWEHRNSYTRLKKQQQLRAYVQLEIHGVFISIVDDGNGGGGVGAPRRMPREVMSISLSARHADTGIQVSYGLVTDGRHVVNTRIGHLQVDNQLLDTNYPVMVFPIRLDDTVQQDQSATTAASLSGSPTSGGALGGRTRSNGTLPDAAKQPGSEGASSTRSDRILLPTFQLMGVFSKRRTLVQFEYIFAQLQELDVKLEDAVLVATAQAMSGINWSLLGYGSGSATEKQQQAAAIGDAALNLVDARWPFPNTPEFPLTMLHVEHRGGNTKMLLRWLLFCPIKMNVTFTSTTDRANLLSLVSPEMSSVLRTLISAAAALVSNLDNAAIKVPEFYLENVLETTHTLGFYTMQHYVHHGLRSWYRIVGSVDFLGNPIGLVSALGTGVKDFFYTPAQMLLEDENGLRIENLRTGMTKGSKSLLRNTAVGIFHTTGKITETLGKGIALLAMDDEYNVERQRQTTRQKKKINDLGDAIAEGGKGLVGGVWDGVKGVITAPVRGAERDGAGGFVVGIGQGFAGLFVKPAAGFLDMLTSLSRGAKSSAEAIDGGYDHGGLTVTRARLPRRICADGVLVSFSEREARGCAILALTSLDLTDDYVYHLDYGVDSPARGMLLLTDKRVLCLSAKSGQKLWELALDSSLQVETNGAAFLTIAQSKTSHKVYKIECDDETAASNFKLAVSSARVELSATRYLLLNLEKKQDEARQHALLGDGSGMHGYDDDGRVDLSLLMGNLQDTLVTGLTEQELRTQPLRSVQVELCHLENKDAAASVPSRAVDKVLSFSVFQILVYGGPYQWTVYRRFSEFRDLYATLQKTGHSVDALPPLPGRTFLPSTRSAVATQRQEALSLLLQAAIMHSSISGSHAMLEFLTRSAHEVRVSLPPLSPTAANSSNAKAGGGGGGTVGASSMSGILRTP